MQNNKGAIGTVITVFFFWGFIAAGNNIFIPFCRTYFDLDQFQGQLIDFAFYFAYYIGALCLYAFGALNGKDVIRSWGYKKSIVIGLLLSAVGAIVMIVAVKGDTFAGMLIGLFVVALGFSIQQTSANPLLISLGAPKTGASRVSLGGGINSLGTTIGPLLVALALFGTTAASETGADAIGKLNLNKVVFLYGGVSLLFIALAMVFKFSKSVANDATNEVVEKSKKALAALLIITGLLVTCFVPILSSYASKEANQITELQKMAAPIQVELDAQTKLSNSSPKSLAYLTTQIKTINDAVTHIKKPLDKKRMIWSSLGILVVLGGLSVSLGIANKQKTGWGALQYPQLVLGMIAIFIYVGVEVAIGSNLPELLKQKEFKSLTDTQIAPYIAMYWGSLMIGRWGGAVDAFDLSKSTKTILYAVAPLTALAVVLALTAAAGHSVKPFYLYVVCVAIQIGAFFFTKNRTALTLTVFSILGAITVTIGMLTSGEIATYSILSAGLCCSIMWPSIFALSIAGLGKYTSQGSAFLIMMILGGALIPPFQGKLSDIIGIQQSYIVGVICFIYLAIFAMVASNILKKQGVDLSDESTSH
jgi:FHS family L-fucose permease-like MFS transporter